MSAYVLDARNLLCPMPVIKLQNEIKTLNKGDTLTLRCTDPGTLQDIPCWCRMYEHDIISIDETDDEIVIRVQK